MSVANYPELCAPLAVVLVALVIWANRCSKCGKLFTYKLRSRDKTSEGYNDSWEVDEKTQFGKSVRRYTYRYDVTYACSKCGHEYSTSTSSSRSLPCGYFLPEDHADAKKQGRGCFNPLTWLGWLNPLAWWRSIPGKRYLPLLPITFFIGMIVFDPEVLWYPTHYQSYLEEYAEFLLKPLLPRTNRLTRLEIVEGRWQTQRHIQEYRQVEYEAWENSVPSYARVIEKATKPRPESLSYTSQSAGTKFDTWVKYSVDLWVTVDTLTASGTSLSIVYPDDPTAATGEAVYGALRSEAPSVKYSLVFKEVETGKVYLVDSIGFIRIEDRAFTWQGEIGLNAYSRLIKSSQALTARVYTRSYSKLPRIYIYVDEHPAEN